MLKFHDRIAARRSRAASEENRIEAERLARMSAEWHDTYTYARRGLAQRPIVLDAPQAPSGMAASLRGFARSVIVFSGTVVAAGFAFGVMDAHACGDNAAAAEAKAFYGLDDVIIDGFRTVSLKLFSSLDLLNAMDAAVQATAFCVATLLAKGAALGAMAYALVT